MVVVPPEFWAVFVASKASPVSTPLKSMAVASALFVFALKETVMVCDTFPSTEVQAKCGYG